MIAAAHQATRATLSTRAGIYGWISAIQRGGESVRQRGLANRGRAGEQIRLARPPVP